VGESLSPSIAGPHSGKNYDLEGIGHVSFHERSSPAGDSRRRRLPNDDFRSSPGFLNRVIHLESASLRRIIDGTIPRSRFSVMRR